MNLLVDIGNTSTHIGISGSNRILFNFALATNTNYSIPEIQKKLSKYKGRIKFAAISSVVPSKDVFWKSFIQKKIKINPLIVTSKSKLPIIIRIKNPVTLGADRICNAVAGYSMFKGKSSVIVIDLGTATTYDVILKNGGFVGGIIAPGIETSAKALHSKTGKLPMLRYKEFRFPRKIVGKNTLEAIQSGIMFSASILIDGMIKQIEADYGRKFKVIMTGGLSKLIYRKVKSNIKLESNLVLKGLDQIIKHQYSALTF